MRTSFGIFFASSSLPLVSARSLRSQAVTRMTTWSDCGLEGDALPKGGLTSFGFGEDWVEATLPLGASCSVAAFGEDPAPGIRKACQCSDEQGSVQKRDELGVSWTFCGNEGEDCVCASGAMRFGSGKHWAVADLGENAESPTRSCSAKTVNHANPSFAAVRHSVELLAESSSRHRDRECWCQTAAARPPPAKVAIVLLSRRPFDIKTWFQYHLDYMGVDHIFMQVEDTPNFNTTLGSMSRDHQARVTAWTAQVGSHSDKRPTDDYETLQARQMKAMRHAHSEAAKMGIDWLIHTDDDELLYAPSHRTVGDVLASMPKNFDEAYMPNVEAVYPSADVQNCFTETQEFNSNGYTFSSYANGKAAVRVANLGAQPAGPHMWRDARNQDLNAIHLDKQPFGAPLMVIHYESCPFKRWETKYWELGNTSPEKVKSIPFPFYRDSIEAMQSCASSDQSKNGIVEVGTGPCSEDFLKQFWSSYKTLDNKRIRRKDLVAIEIPWASIQKADL